MKENIIKGRSFAFALRIIKLYQFLQTERKEFILSKQLLRCGISVGAMMRESEQAESKLDFIHKLAIAKKKQTKQNIGLNFFISRGI
jgi:four helix bundle protein